jgi:hypothetical protein
MGHSSFSGGGLQENTARTTFVTQSWRDDMIDCGGAIAYVISDLVLHQAAQPAHAADRFAHEIGLILRAIMA